MEKNKSCKVQQSVEDIAEELIDLYKEREMGRRLSIWESTASNNI